MHPRSRRLEQEPAARELEVLQLISDGLVNREIGDRLFLSEETVKSHVRHLLAKPPGTESSPCGVHRVPPRANRLRAKSS